SSLPLLLFLSAPLLLSLSAPLLLSLSTPLLLSSQPLSSFPFSPSPHLAHHTPGSLTHPAHSHTLLTHTPCSLTHPALVNLRTTLFKFSIF
ncbi:unnamed protein product, partial [Closterium sp. Naga37s-1]